MPKRKPQICAFFFLISIRVFHLIHLPKCALVGRLIEHSPCLQSLISGGEALNVLDGMLETVVMVTDVVLLVS